MVWPLYLWYAQYASSLYQLGLNIDGENTLNRYSSIKFTWNMEMKVMKEMMKVMKEMKGLIKVLG